MLSAARLPQVRAEACISLQASWEWSKVWTVRTIFGELKVQLRNESWFVEVSEGCSGEQTFAQLRTGFTLHAALQNKSIVCSGSRVSNSTVMKLYRSDNRGGVIVKTYKEHLLTLVPGNYSYALGQLTRSRLLSVNCVHQSIAHARRLKWKGCN